MHKVPRAPPFHLAASSSLGPLHRATSSAPTKKRAPPGSAAAPRAKKVYSNPYTVFCQEQRPLLPRSLRNSQREWTLGQMWKSLPDEERAKYKPEEGTVRKAARCNVGLVPFPGSLAPVPGPTHATARAPSVDVPLAIHVAAGAPQAVLPAAPSAAPPTQLQLTQTLQVHAANLNPNPNPNAYPNPKPKPNPNPNPNAAAGAPQLQLELLELELLLWQRTMRWICLKT